MVPWWEKIIGNRWSCGFLYLQNRGVFLFGGGLDFDRWEDLFLYLYPFDIISIDLESCSRLRIFF